MSEPIYKRKNGRYSSHNMIIDMIDRSGVALDLGSSGGILTDDLLLKGVSSVCVDICDPKFASASCKAYHQFDLEKEVKIHFDEKFDVVIMADVIEHLRNPEILIKSAKENLKTGGEIIISTPNIAIWVYRFSLLFGEFNYTEKGILDKTHVKLYTLKTIRNLVIECGLEVQEIKFTSIPFELIIKNRFALSIIEPIYAFFVKLLPAIFSYQIILRTRISQ